MKKNKKTVARKKNQCYNIENNHWSAGQMHLAWEYTVFLSGRLYSIKIYAASAAETRRNENTGIL